MESWRLDPRNIVLLASLAFNLLVLGAIGSHFLFEKQPTRERYSGPAFTDILPRTFFLALDPERRRALAERFAGDRKAFRDGRRDMRQAAIKVADTLKAEPYDAAETEAALARYDAISRSMIDRGATVSRDLVATLKPEERTLLADKIRDRAEHPRRPHRRSE
ncbi:MAG TPA: periplasmic heavy metal sensor [Aestuariivirgaceae bacterium]|jgi:uncharacterized membrane protein|nr:periplasmic heavy metal sensor [Aestuariivirgaceae bacterium]